MREFKTIDDFSTLDIILDKLKGYKTGDKLYYVRFGDGCIIMMYPETLNKMMGLSNQFMVTEELQQELYNTWNIIDDSYLFAGSLNLSSPFSSDQGQAMHNKIRQLFDSKCITERFNFYSHPTFERNFIYKPEKFLEFCHLIRDKKKVWDNQSWHNNIESILGNVQHHILTPKTNSYSNIDEWYPELLKTLDDVEVVILASGQSSRVLAGRLWKEGVNKIVLDIGSVADMFIANTSIFAKGVRPSHHAWPPQGPVNEMQLRGTMITYRTEILNSLDFILNELDK